MRIWLGILALLLLPGPAMAQAELYGPQPPRGSAFVRFANALGTDVLIEPDFMPGARLGTTPAQRIGAYAVVESVVGRPLTVVARDGEHTGRATWQVAPGSFVTVLLRRGPDAGIPGAGIPDAGIQAIPVVDRADFNQARARLSFYNATLDCAAAGLALAPSGPAVFQDVAPGTAKVRTVNPVSASVQASCAGQPTTAFALDGLEASSMYSVWLMRLDGQPTAFLTQDITPLWHP